MVCKTYIMFRIDYDSQMYASVTSTPLRRLDVKQNNCERFVALYCVARIEVEARIPSLRLSRDDLTLVYVNRTGRDEPLPSSQWATSHLADSGARTQAIRLTLLRVASSQRGYPRGG